MIQQKAAPRFVGVFREMPRATRFADGIPRPHGARLHRLRVAAHAAHLAVHGFHPQPAAVGDACGLCCFCVYKQIVMRVYLAQPGVLRIPRVVHRHGPLGDRGERIFLFIRQRHFQRLVIKRQRIEIFFDAIFQMRGRLALAVAARCEAKALQHLGVQLNHDRIAEAP